ncbi:alkene reductase [Kaistia sp. 32K]|uniref:alkene reductase n=1 Tax=Kaistia sp. 32K TaxID=2795690 RepID=UPI001916110B|nr:alkene reductase [Kaistia sp. 32K]BCP51503.1 alkene reductase [Kaistia sp. 32K]
MSDIWTPARIGSIDIANRLAMAPMTRSRAEADGTPGALAAQYYEQRAGLGLIIAEGTQPSADGQGYLTTPGIYTDAHVEGWKKIASAIHAQGSRLFIQLMHAGRTSHPDNTPHHRQAVAPSAVQPGGEIFTPTGMQSIPEPRALTIEEVRQTVDDFRNAARHAVDAGADGVEIHGANGYLVQQFLAPNANLRTDSYGGSLQNRARFAIEVATAVAAEIGADRVGIRLSPGATFGGLDEGAEGPDLYRYLVSELNKLGLAYVHLLHLGNEALLADIRSLWDQALILNRPGRKLEDVGSDVKSGIADLEAYGQFVLSTPDFVERLKSGAALNKPDNASFYGGGAEGYVDYPTLNETVSA